MEGLKEKNSIVRFVSTIELFTTQLTVHARHVTMVTPHDLSSVISRTILILYYVRSSASEQDELV